MAQLSAQTVANLVAHDDQLTIWADDIIDALADWMSEPESYDDNVACANAAKREIKKIVAAAFELAADRKIKIEI